VSIKIKQSDDGRWLLGEQTLHPERDPFEAARVDLGNLLDGGVPVLRKRITWSQRIRWPAQCFLRPGRGEIREVLKTPGNGTRYPVKNEG
jgi:hypothetical protein